MKKIVLFLAAISLLACKDNTQGTASKTEAETQDVSVELYALDGGNVGVNKLSLFSQGDKYEGESKQLVDAFYVIKHPKGTLIWDTGLPENLVGQDPYTTPDGGFTISRNDSIVNQLATIGLKPNDVDYIAFSHIHFDHTGAANHFKNATWLVQQQEYDFAMSDSIKGNAFYAPDSFSQLTNVETLNGDKDVFGDGTVIVKSMPGHTPGHQVLYLELAEAGPVLLSGDMYHFHKNREQKIVPQFNYSIPETNASIKAFEAFAKEKNARVYIQHEPDDFNSMPKAPKALK